MKIMIRVRKNNKVKPLNKYVKTFYIDYGKIYQSEKEFNLDFGIKTVCLWEDM